MGKRKGRNTSSTAIKEKSGFFLEESQHRPVAEPVEAGVSAEDLRTEDNGANDDTSEEESDGNELDGQGDDDREEEEVDSDEDSDEDDSEPDEDEEDEEEDVELDGESEDEKAPVNVDFEFFDPKPVDFHGVKALLKRYLDDATWNLTGLVETVIGQTTIGTVVKVEDDENPLGVISALNLCRYKKEPWVEDLQKFLKAASHGKPEAGQLDALLAAAAQKKNVGLLISERLVNIPIEIAPPLHQGLFDEIMWGQEDEKTRELRHFAKFEEFLLLTRVFQEVASASKSNKKAKKEATGDVKGGGAGDLIYIKPEDEVFHKLASWSFTFPVQGAAHAARQTKGLKELRLVMAMDPKKVPTFKANLKKLVEEGD